jgi:hypothetical protein
MFFLERSACGTECECKSLGTVSDTAIFTTGVTPSCIARGLLFLVLSMAIIISFKTKMILFVGALKYKQHSLLFCTDC